MHKFDFDKAKHVCQASLFQSILAKPQYRLSERALVLLAVRNEMGIARLGVVVSKRNFSKAVVRNRLKRVVRESFRYHQHQLDSFDFIIIVKKEMIRIEKQDQHLQLQRLWLHFQNTYE